MQFFGPNITDKMNASNKVNCTIAPDWARKRPHKENKKEGRSKAAHPTERRKGVDSGREALKVIWKALGLKKVSAHDGRRMHISARTEPASARSGKSANSTFFKGGCTRYYFHRNRLSQIVFQVPSIFLSFLSLSLC